MRTLGRLTICVLFALTLVPPVSAGQIADNLLERISSNPSDQKLSVWVVLRSDLTDRPLKAAAVDQSTRKGRYQTVMTQLQQNSAESQQALIEALSQHEAAGRVQQVKQHWLVNVIEVDI
ncbi:MAG: hypothetical protein KAW61_00585, partial [candidate division Zixibacteria bacterium]|nr:hypothetical protein [candidate division Zixibacteria bacterium]